MGLLTGLLQDLPQVQAPLMVFLKQATPKLRLTWNRDLQTCLSRYPSIIPSYSGLKNDVVEDC